MKNFKLFSILAFCLLGILSCEDEDKILAIPPQGALVTITPDGVKVFDINNTTGSVYSGELRDATNNVANYRLMVSIYDKTSRTSSSQFEVFSSDSFPANMSISAADILSGLGITADDVIPGDLVQFRAIIETDDGRVFDHETLNGDANGEGLLGAYQWDVPFFCPFVASDALGTYSVTVNSNEFDWEIASTTEAISHDDGIRFVDLFGSGKHLDVTIDPETAAADSRTNILGASLLGYANPYLRQAGDAYFFSCTGSYELALQQCVDLGCFNASDYPTGISLNRQ